MRDGDSIHITPSHGRRVVIRLAAIDAPELAQRFGVESRDHLRALVLHRLAEARCHKADKYNREVCTVFIGDKDINLLMLQAGLAWYYVAYQQEQSARDRRRYTDTQATARKRRTGLWAGSAEAPWDFRRRN
ncbi:MAG: thermonuclease family protein [Pseudomonadota bacterium]